MEKSTSKPHNMGHSIMRYETGRDEPRAARARRLAVILGDPGLREVRTHAERLRARQGGLEGRVSHVEEGLDALGPQLEEMADRLSELERLARSRRRGSGSTGAGQD